MSGGHGLFGGSMWLYWILIGIGLIFFISWIIRQNKPEDPNVNVDPKEILKRRYAEGKIEKKEFEQKMKDLL